MSTTAVRTDLSHHDGGPRARRRVLRSAVALGFALSATCAVSSAAPAHAAVGDTVWTAGLNNDCQLGDGTRTNRGSFAAVAGMGDNADIAGGRQHVLASRSGKVWAWGNGGRGALGTGSGTDLTVPTEVPGLTGVDAITTGHYGSYALVDGTIRAWGYNANGQLGDGTTTQRPSPVTVRTASGAALSGVKQVAAGRDFAMAVITRNGSVRTWGRGLDGELGNGTTPTAQLTPVTVRKQDGTTLTGVAQVAAGRNHTLALLGDGSVYAWGENAYGQVGDATTVDKTRAVRIMGFGGVRVTDVEAGAEFSTAVLEDGTVRTWGRGGNGQLGTGGTANTSTPTAVPGLTGVVGAGCGRDHAVVWTAGGAAYGWGYDAYGQLGGGTGTTKRLLPVRVPGVSDVVKAHGGFGYTVLKQSAG